MSTSRSLNKVFLIGNLSRNPVLRKTPNESVVCTFGIATNSSWKSTDGTVQERTEFHNIVAWNKLGEICAEILSTGMLVYVEGELRTRNWEDEKGIRHYRTEIKIAEMKLLDPKGKKGIGMDAAMNENGKDDEPIIDETPAPSKSSSKDDEVTEEDMPF